MHPHKPKKQNPTNSNKHVLPTDVNDYGTWLRGLVDDNDDEADYSMRLLRQPLAHSAAAAANSSSFMNSMMADKKKKVKHRLYEGIRSIPHHQKNSGSSGSPVAGAGKTPTPLNDKNQKNTRNNNTNNGMDGEKNNQKQQQQQQKTNGLLLPAGMKYWYVTMSHMAENSMKEQEEGGAREGEGGQQGDKSGKHNSNNSNKFVTEQKRLTMERELLLYWIIGNIHQHYNNKNKQPQSSQPQPQHNNNNIDNMIPIKYSSTATTPTIAKRRGSSSDAQQHQHQRQTAERERRRSSSSNTNNQHFEKQHNDLFHILSTLHLPAMDGSGSAIHIMLSEHYHNIRHLQQQQQEDVTSDDDDDGDSDGDNSSSGNNGGVSAVLRDVVTSAAVRDTVSRWRQLFLLAPPLQLFVFEYVLQVSATVSPRHLMATATAVASSTVPFSLFPSFVSSSSTSHVVGGAPSTTSSSSSSSFVTPSRRLSTLSLHSLASVPTTAAASNAMVPTSSSSLLSSRSNSTVVSSTIITTSSHSRRASSLVPHAPPPTEHHHHSVSPPRRKSTGGGWGAPSAPPLPSLPQTPTYDHVHYCHSTVCALDRDGDGCFTVEDVIWLVDSLIRPPLIVLYLTSPALYHRDSLLQAQKTQQRQYQQQQKKNGTNVSGVYSKQTQQPVVKQRQGSTTTSGGHNASPPRRLSHTQSSGAYPQRRGSVNVNNPVRRGSNSRRGTTATTDTTTTTTNQEDGPPPRNGGGETLPSGEAFFTPSARDYTQVFVDTVCNSIVMQCVATMFQPSASALALPSSQRVTSTPTPGPDSAADATARRSSLLAMQRRASRDTVSRDATPGRTGAPPGERRRSSIGSSNGHHHHSAMLMDAVDDEGNPLSDKKIDTVTLLMVLFPDCPRRLLMQTFRRYQQHGGDMALPTTAGDGSDTSADEAGAAGEAVRNSFSGEYGDGGGPRSAATSFSIRFDSVDRMHSCSHHHGGIGSVGVGSSFSLLSPLWSLGSFLGEFYSYRMGRCALVSPPSTPASAASLLLSPLSVSSRVTVVGEDEVEEVTSMLRRAMGTRARLGTRAVVEIYKLFNYFLNPSNESDEDEDSESRDSSSRYSSREGSQQQGRTKRTAAGGHEGSDNNDSCVGPAGPPPQEQPSVFSLTEMSSSSRRTSSDGSSGVNANTAGTPDSGGSDIKRTRHERLRERLLKSLVASASSTAATTSSSSSSSFSDVVGSSDALPKITLQSFLSVFSRFNPGTPKKKETKTTEEERARAHRMASRRRSAQGSSNGHSTSRSSSVCHNPEAKKEVIRMFKEADSDGNGELDFEEFLNMMKVCYAPYCQVHVDAETARDYGFNDHRNGGRHRKHDHHSESHRMHRMRSRFPKAFTAPMRRAAAPFEAILTHFERDQRTPLHPLPPIGFGLRTQLKEEEEARKEWERRKEQKKMRHRKSSRTLWLTSVAKITKKRRQTLLTGVAPSPDKLRSMIRDTDSSSSSDEDDDSEKRDPSGLLLPRHMRSLRHQGRRELESIKFQLELKRELEVRLPLLKRSLESKGKK